MPIEVSSSARDGGGVWQARRVDSAFAAAVVEEAARRAGLIWVRRTDGDDPARALWFTWHDGSGYVLTGGGEQPAPEGLAADARVEITITSKDKRSRLLTVIATVHPIAAETDEWAGVIPMLRAKRLNLPDGEAAVTRWARESALWRLRPTGDYVDEESGGTRIMPSAISTTLPDT
jgi:hypothetical protein